MKKNLKKILPVLMLILAISFQAVLAAPELEDGEYTVEGEMTGGSGRASIESPLPLTVKDGKMTATCVWSSVHYTFMEIDGVRYDKVNEEGNSTFEVPVVLDEEIPFKAETVAMSQPHTIEYTLFLDSSTLEGGPEKTEEKANPSVWNYVALIAIILLACWVSKLITKRKKEN